MDIRRLGLVSAHRSGRPIALGPRRQRFVLAVLALEVNRAVPVDRLVELAWPVSAPRTRPARDPGVRVLAAVSPRGCRGGARRGADRHPGRFVHPAGRSRADRRPSLPCPPARLTALEDRLEARLRLGQHRAALGELADLIEVHPTRERLVELHMIALYRSGQAGPALAAYPAAPRAAGRRPRPRSGSATAGAGAGDSPQRTRAGRTRPGRAGNGSRSRSRPCRGSCRRRCAGSPAGGGRSTNWIRYWRTRPRPPQWRSRSCRVPAGSARPTTD